ncbi:MAG: hypothetical protein AAFR05_08610 [Bacteroidota bacterium]
MITDLREIREKLVAILKDHLGPLRITSDTYEKFEVIGTIATLQGKQKVEGC